MNITNTTNTTNPIGIDTMIIIATGGKMSAKMFLLGMMPMVIL
jgi:hypothetical protein